MDGCDCETDRQTQCDRTQKEVKEAMTAMDCNVTGFSRLRTRTRTQSCGGIQDKIRVTLHALRPPPSAPGPPCDTRGTRGSENGVTSSSVGDQER